MKMRCTGGSSDLGCVVDSKSGSGGDLNAAAGLLDQARNGSGTCDHIPLTARGENPVTARGDHVFEGLVKRRREIEGAMKGDLERSGQLDQLAGALEIDRSILAKDAQRKASDTKRSRVQQIFAYEGELSVSVMEATWAGTQHDMDWKSAVLDRSANQSMARR